jgi:hypothetical protein
MSINLSIFGSKGARMSQPPLSWIGAISRMLPVLCWWAVVTPPPKKIRSTCMAPVVCKGEPTWPPSSAGHVNSLSHTSGRKSAESCSKVLRGGPWHLHTESTYCPQQWGPPRSPAAAKPQSNAASNHRADPASPRVTHTHHTRDLCALNPVYFSRTHSAYHATLAMARR